MKYIKRIGLLAFVCLFSLFFYTSEAKAEGTLDITFKVLNPYTSELMEEKVISYQENNNMFYAVYEDIEECNLIIPDSFYYYNEFNFNGSRYICVYNGETNASYTVVDQLKDILNREVQHQINSNIQLFTLTFNDESGNYEMYTVPSIIGMNIRCQTKDEDRNLYEPLIIEYLPLIDEIPLNHYLNNNDYEFMISTIDENPIIEQNTKTLNLKSLWIEKGNHAPSFSVAIAPQVSYHDAKFSVQNPWGEYEEYSIFYDFFKEDVLRLKNEEEIEGFPEGTIILYQGNGNFQINLPNYLYPNFFDNTSLNYGIDNLHVDEVLKLPTRYSNTGYDLGCYSEEDCFLNLQQAQEPIILSAKYDNIIKLDRKKYKITMNNEKGILLENDEFYCGTRARINLLNTEGYNLSKDPYEFIFYTLNDNKITLEMPAENITLKPLILTPRDDTKYSIYCYQQKADGSYSATPDWIDEDIGVTDSTVTILSPVKQIPSGYHAKQSEEITILGNGTAKVDFYLERNTYKVNVTANDKIKSTNIKESYRWGTYPTIKITPLEGYKVIALQGDVSINSDNVTFLMPQNHINIEVIIAPRDDTPYTVNHYVMNTDGSYSETPNKTETFTGTTESELTNLNSYKKSSLEVINGISYDRCEVNGNTATSAIIKNDGTTTLNLYYDRLSYTVLLNKGKGIENLPNSITCLYGQEVILPNVDCLQGYEFNNWTGDINSSVLNYKFSMPINNISITANGKPINYKITYKLNGGGFHSTYFTTYTVEDSDFTLINPTRLGYDFAGWTTENEVSPKTQTIVEKGTTGDLKFIANWDTVDYQIVYNLNGGNLPEAAVSTYNIESETFTVKNPTKENYVFVGWSGTINGEEIDITDNLIISKGNVGNIDITAVWTLANVTVNGINDCYYTGNPITIDNLSLTTSTGVIPQDCYDVTYKNNVNIGTAIIIIVLKNGYEGTITENFQILMQENYTEVINDIIYQVVEENGNQIVAVQKPNWEKDDKTKIIIDIPKTITIGGIEYKVVIIKEKAFEGYTCIKEIILGENITQIQKDAFKNCSSLTTITAKNDTIKIDKEIISGCTNLNNYPGKPQENTNDSTEKPQTEETNKKDDKTEEVLQKDTTVKIGDSFIYKNLKYKITKITKNSGEVTVVGSTKSKNKLTSLTIGKTVKYKNKTYKITAINTKTFKGYTKIKKVTIGDNVKTIGKEAFSGCKAISTLKIGKNVSKIDSKAFYNCEKLKSITTTSKKLKTIGTKAFTNINKKAIIKVPKAKLKAYKKLFKSKVGFKKTMKITK